MSADSETATKAVHDDEFPFDSFEFDSRMSRLPPRFFSILHIELDIRAEKELLSSMSDPRLHDVIGQAAAQVCRINMAASMLADVDIARLGELFDRLNELECYFMLYPILVSMIAAYANGLLLPAIEARTADSRIQSNGQALQKRLWQRYEEDGASMSQSKTAAEPISCSIFKGPVRPQGPTGSRSIVALASALGAAPLLRAALDHLRSIHNTVTRDMCTQLVPSVRPASTPELVKRRRSLAVVRKTLRKHSSAVRARTRPWGERPKGSKAPPHEVVVPPFEPPLDYSDGAPLVSRCPRTRPMVFAARCGCAETVRLLAGVVGQEEGRWTGLCQAAWSGHLDSFNAMLARYETRGVGTVASRLWRRRIPVTSPLLEAAKRGNVEVLRRVLEVLRQEKEEKRAGAGAGAGDGAAGRGLAAPYTGKLVDELYGAFKTAAIHARPGSMELLLTEANCDIKERWAGKWQVWYRQKSLLDPSSSWGHAGHDVGSKRDCVRVFQLLGKHDMSVNKVVAMLVLQRMHGALRAIASEPSTAGAVLSMMPSWMKHSKQRLCYSKRVDFLPNGIQMQYNHVSCCTASAEVAAASAALPQEVLDRNPPVDSRTIVLSMLQLDCLGRSHLALGPQEAQTYWAQHDGQGRPVPTQHNGGTEAQMWGYWRQYLKDRVGELMQLPDSKALLGPEGTKEKHRGAHLDLLGLLFAWGSRRHREAWALDVLHLLARLGWRPFACWSADANEKLWAHIMRPAVGTMRQCTLVLLGSLMQMGWPVSLGSAAKREHGPAAELADESAWARLTWRRDRRIAIADAVRRGAWRHAGALIGQRTAARRMRERAGPLTTLRQAALVRWKEAIRGRNAVRLVWGMAGGWKPLGLQRCLAGGTKSACLAVRGLLPHRDGVVEHEGGGRGGGARGIEPRGGCTLLMAAAFTASPECVKVLLDAEASADDVDDQGKDALWWARSARPGSARDACIKMLE